MKRTAALIVTLAFVTCPARAEDKAEAEPASPFAHFPRPDNAEHVFGIATPRHHADVLSIAFRQKAKALVAFDTAGLLTVWSLKTGTMVHATKVTSHAMRAAVSPDGRYVAYGDGTNDAYDLSLRPRAIEQRTLSPLLKKSFDDHAQETVGIAELMFDKQTWFTDAAFTFGVFGNVEELAWKRSSRSVKVRSSYAIAGAGVSTAGWGSGIPTQLVRQGRGIAVYFGRTMWGVADGVRETTLGRPTGGIEFTTRFVVGMRARVTALTTDSVKSKWLIGADADGNIKRWGHDRKTLDDLTVLHEHNPKIGSIRQLWLSEDARVLFALGETALVGMNAQKGTVKWSIPHEGAHVTATATSSKLRVLARALAGGLIETYKLRSGGAGIDTPARAVLGANAGVGSRMELVGDDVGELTAENDYVVWTSDGSERLRFRADPAQHRAAAITTDGAVLQFVQRDADFVAVRQPTDEVAWTREGLTTSAAAVSADGQRLACTVADGVTVLNTSTGEDVSARPITGSLPALSLDGALVAVQTSSAVVVRDLKGTRVDEYPSPDKATIDSFALSPDGQTLAVSVTGKGVFVRARGVEGAGERKPHVGYKGAVALAFAADGATLLGGYADGTVVEWKPDTPPRLLFGHLGPVTGLRALPDGRIISTGADGQAFIWQAAE